MPYSSPEARNQYLRDWKRAQRAKKKTASGLTYMEIKQRATDTHKNCSQCGAFKALDEFPKDRRSLLARAAQCNSCRSTYNSTYLQRDYVKEKSRARARRPHNAKAARRRWVVAHYGEDALPLEERRAAGDPCDACPGQDNVGIDHCHNTGTARGLLCRDCNLALGYAHDDPARLRALADYLDRTSGASSPMQLA